MAGEHRGSIRGRGQQGRSGRPVVGANNIMGRAPLVGKRQRRKGAASLDSIPLNVRREIRTALGGTGVNTVAKNIIGIAINHGEPIARILQLMLDKREHKAVKAKVEQILAEMMEQRR